VDGGLGKVLPPTSKHDMGACPFHMAESWPSAAKVHMGLVYGIWPQLLTLELA